MTTLKDIRLSCPVCEKEFASRQVAEEGALRGKHTDFQPHRADLQATRFDVHVCPTCGYAGKVDAFGGDIEVSGVIVERVWNELAPRVGGAALTGSDQFELAAKVATWSECSPMSVADLYLRASWCCVDEGDVEAERYFRRHAVWAFESALAAYDTVEPEYRALLTYLVGELWRRIGYERRAHEWFDRVSEEIVDDREQQWIVELARGQKDDPREWIYGWADQPIGQRR